MRLLGASVVIQHGGFLTFPQYFLFLLENFKSYSENALFNSLVCKICFIIYILFDGLAYNTCGYFASCVVFFLAPAGLGKIRAMSKMSARIIC